MSLSDIKRRGRGNWEIKHGGCRRGARLPEYNVWAGMLSRCRNPNVKSYADYGGRGIAVCERWSDFAAFYEDMGPRPTASHTIERRDVNGPYEPENCCWVTRSAQNANKRPRKLKSCCVRGHKFTDDNVYIRSNGKRSCKTCRALAMVKLKESGYFKARQNGKRRGSGKSPPLASAT